MNLPRYQSFVSPNLRHYEFISEGPKGIIRKFVQFSKINDHPTIYNLAFGDLDTDRQTIDDLVVTNNGDRNKILATIAFIIDDFSIQKGFNWIAIEGSTFSRTRLYQMAISYFWNDLHERYEIFGWFGGTWRMFEIGQNYEAFLVRKK